MRKKRQKKTKKVSRRWGKDRKARENVRSKAASETHDLLDEALWSASNTIAQRPPPLISLFCFVRNKLSSGHSFNRFEFEESRDQRPAIDSLKVTPMHCIRAPRQTKPGITIVDNSPPDRNAVLRSPPPKKQKRQTHAVERVSSLVA